MHTICVVEDDPTLLNFIVFNLNKEGYHVNSYSHGEEALMALQILLNSQLIILDNMLPGKSGIDICQAIRRQSSVPILFLSAKGNTSDKIEGLKAGANDYLSKPFDLEELMLRIQVLLPKKISKYTLGTFEIDFEAMQVINLQNQQIHALTKKETELLKLFIERENQVLSRDEILDKVWGEEVYPTTRTIDNFVLTFRRIFEPDQKNPVFFQSIRSVGYKFTNSYQ